MLVTIPRKVKGALVRAGWCDAGSVDDPRAVAEAVERMLAALAVREAQDGATKPAPADTLSKLGAEQLCDTIAGHWRARGYRINAWVEKVNGARLIEAAFGVRSDLVSGLPSARTARGPAAALWNVGAASAVPRASGERSGSLAEAPPEQMNCEMEAVRR